MEKSKIASNKTIFNHLFAQMISLQNGDISVEEAKAQANLAKQTNNITRYELDRAVAIAKFGEIIEIREVDGK